MTLSTVSSRKYLIRSVIGLALAGCLAAPAGADTPPLVPQQSIGDAAATGDAAEVHTLATDPITQAQLDEADARARKARTAAQDAVRARKRAERKAGILLARAQRLRTRGAVNSWAAADRAAQQAARRAEALKKAAQKAHAHANALRAAALRQSRNSSSQHSAIASSPTSTSTDRNRSLVMDLANQARAAVGCDPLNYNLLLESSAQGHAEDMAARHYMSHTSPDGRTFDERIRATGYDGGRIGENIGEGFGDAGSIMDAWMHSAPHKANILDCRFRNIGVGYDLDGGYWVQNFGS